MLIALLVCTMVGLSAHVPVSGLSAAQDDGARAGENGPRIRIGTYDSRAIAVAYARSEQFASHMRELQRRRAEAVKAKDKKLIEQLEAQGQAMQIRMHLQ